MHLLVITNETAGGDVLHDTVRGIALAADADVTIVAPALNSRLRHWLSDEDAARAAAGRRLASCIERLLAAGVRVTGRVGDADPMKAIEDALAVAPVDELILATHPEGRSNWLEHDLVTRACARFGLPVAHIVVDVEAGVERLALVA